MTWSLAGLSVLIVEDDIVTGMMLFSEVTRAGGISIGPVTSVAGALKEIQSQVVQAVVLDAKLVDGSGADLAACLEERQIPYVVFSGCDEASLPRALRAAPFVAKPVSVPILMEAIAELDAGDTRDGRENASTGA